MNKKIAAILAVLILTLSIGSAAFAASGYKDLKAWYNNIKIFKNGQQVQLDFEPFIIDGYTYVPLRAVGELFNKDFDWDGTNYTINIKDRPDTNLNAMMKQIVDQQVTISTLEAKVKSLEAEAAKAPAISSVSDLEKQLNKDYGTYDKVDFDISLYGSKDKIDVRIYIDTRSDSNEFGKWYNSDVKYFLQDIVDDIIREFKNAKITGFIEDKYAKSKKTTFSVSTKGVVSVGTSKGNYNDIDDLEDYLDSEYYGTRGIRKIQLDGDDDDIYVYIDVYEDDWLEGYSSSSRESFIKGICSIIEDDFPHADLTIYIYNYWDDEKIETFYY